MSHIHSRMEHTTRAAQCPVSVLFEAVAILRTWLLGHLHRHPPRARQRLVNPVPLLPVLRLPQPPRPSLAWVQQLRCGGPMAVETQADAAAVAWVWAWRRAAKANVCARCLANKGLAALAASALDLVLAQEALARV